MPIGLDRINGLLAWWDLPNNICFVGVEARSKQFLLLFAELSTPFSDASSTQARVQSDACARLSHVLQGLPSGRQATELVAAHSSLAVGLTESLVAATQACEELTQQLHTCCGAAVRDLAIEASEDAAAAGGQSDAGRRSGKNSARRGARG